MKYVKERHNILHQFIANILFRIYLHQTRKGPKKEDQSNFIIFLVQFVDQMKYSVHDVMNSNMPNIKITIMIYFFLKLQC